ncbi:AAA family ATPase [Salibacterium qingdaonense]|uniref:AAA domain-containing protein n=1 Tax=Salibacterium qingdaonense TaxID=266892 RepID=A0A1I4LE62_9BACI|nr:hypothetical protein [Salibacterium qingdaonense]SFL89210.1 hypothetical protein SAMN04488054_107115 [Salibacterium qingdaonense]
MPIICIEGPPCSGKTTLSLELADRYGAYVIPASSFRDRSEDVWQEYIDEQRRWQLALEKARSHALVALDGDLFAPLVHAALLHRQDYVQQLLPHFRSAFLEQRLGIPDYYVYHDASFKLLQRRQHRNGSFRRMVPAEAHRRFYSDLLEPLPVPMYPTRAGREEAAARSIIRHLKAVPEYRYDVSFFQQIEHLLQTLSVIK